MILHEGSRCLIALFVAIQLSTQLIVRVQAFATSIRFTNLMQAYVNGMVVVGNVAYISGAIESPIPNSVVTQVDPMDALFIKLNLVNCSIIWANRVGGVQLEQSGVIYRGSDGIDALNKGVVPFPTQNAVAYSFSYKSPIPGLIDPGTDIYSAIIFLSQSNGTYLRYGCNVGGASFVHQMISSQQVDPNQSLLAAVYEAGTSMFVYEVYINATTYTRITRDFFNVFYDLILTPTELVCLGEVSNGQLPGYQGDFDMTVIRYSRTTWQLNYGQSFGSTGRDTLVAGFYDAPTNSIFFTGFAIGEVISHPASVGTGAIVTGQYFLADNSFQILTRFGALTSGNTGTSIAFGPLGELIVSGAVIGSGYAPYGSEDGVVCVYQSVTNLTLINTIYFGGSTFDGASTIVYPYVLLSGYSQVSASTGEYGVGPAIMYLAETTTVQFITTLATTKSLSSVTSTTASSTIASSTSTVKQSSTQATTSVTSSVLMTTRASTKTSTSTVTMMLTTQSATIVMMSTTTLTTATSIIEPSIISSQSSTGAATTTPIIALSASTFSNPAYTSLQSTMATSVFVTSNVSMQSLTRSTTVANFATVTGLPVTSTVPSLINSLAQAGTPPASVVRVSSSNQVQHNSVVVTTIDQLVMIIQVGRSSTGQLGQQTMTITDANSAAKQAAEGQVGLIVGLVVSATLVLIFVQVASLYYCRRELRAAAKRYRANTGTITEPKSLQSQLTEQSDGAFYGGVSIGETAILMAGNTTNATWISGHEVAVPSFLEVTDGIEYVTDTVSKPLAEGGGGVIRYATFKDYGLGSRYVHQYKNGCVAKQVKGTSQAVFLQEIALMWALRNNQTVVELLAFSSAQMTILLPYFEHGPLSRVLVDASVEWSMQTVLQFSSNVFQALCVVHEASIVHNDVKSANFLVTQRDGRLCTVITDFGVCSIQDGNANAVAGLVKNSIQGKTICYSSPEILTSVVVPSEHRKARDVFAGAVILNELMTRQLAWYNVNKDQVIASVLAGQRPGTMSHGSLNESTKAVKQLQDVVASGWHQNFESRPSSATIRAQIEELMAANIKFESAK